MPLVRDAVGARGGGGGGWTLIDPPQWATWASTTTRTYGPTTNPHIWMNLGSSTITMGTGGYYGDAFSTWIGQRFVIDEEPDERTFAEIEAAAEEVARQREARNGLRAQAISRGEELLLSMLDENQREALRQDNQFAVVGSHGTVYRIKRGVSGNIEWLKPDGTLGGRLCAHPSMRHGWIPTEDVMLAQMLALTHDEREFCRVANVHAGARPSLAVAA